MKSVEGMIRMSVNGHHLQGYKRSGQWRFICSFGELGIKYSGSGEPYDMVRDFIELACRFVPPADTPPRRSA